MKLRSLSYILIPVSGLFSIPLYAQDQSPAAPIQLQENPVPAGTPAPSTEAQGTITPTPSPDPAAPAGDTNATAPAGGTNSVAPAPTPDPAAPAANSGMGSPGQNPPPSDPNSLIPPPQEPPQPSPINTAGNEDKQRQDQKVLYYTVKVKADQDEGLIALQAKADKAKSDESKRQALRQYYDLLAKRMKKIDPSLSDWIDVMHSAYLRRLEQVRVEPTIPINPPPTVDAAAGASPTPQPSATPSHKKKRKAASSNNQ